MTAFATGFADELDKIAAKSPGLLARVGKRLKVGKTVLKYGIPAAAAYALWNAVTGLTEGHRELREEGHL